MKQYLKPESLEILRRAIDQLIVRTITTHDVGFAEAEKIDLTNPQEELYCRILQVIYEP